MGCYTCAAYTNHTYIRQKRSKYGETAPDNIKAIHKHARTHTDKEREFGAAVRNAHTHTIERAIARVSGFTYSRFSKAFVATAMQW